MSLYSNPVNEPKLAAAPDWYSSISTWHHDILIFLCSLSKRAKFWKPGSPAPGLDLNEERLLTSEYQSYAIFNNNASLSVQQQRQKLPIFALRNHLLYLVETYQTTIIIGETGCGKSTQIPQYLLEAGWAAEGHQVAVTQPRRVATVTLANRVADERGSVMGEEVGYLIRFDNSTDTKKTRLKFLTDGMLVREMMNDPLLSKYSVVMIDEAHERTLNTDITLGLLKKIQKKREDLRIIVASATLDAEKFFKFFNTNTSGDHSKDTAYIMTVEGRMFPVDIHYTIDPVPNYVQATVSTVMKLHHSEPAGDVLAFMTGQEEVDDVVRSLIQEARHMPQGSRFLQILPMYASLTYREQLRVFERTPQNGRKVVVATNIAETSVTIDGVMFVIDCGFVKLKAYNPETGIEPLVTVPISQASAIQRAGRAGRVRSGKVYRLYPEAEFHKLPLATPPEMQRTDMAAVVLQLKALGVSNILRFSFLSPPPAQNLVRGLELLFALEAIDSRCELTDPMGLQMAEFPLSPMFAKMLLASEQFGCSVEAVKIAAMMQINNVFVTPAQNKSKARRGHRKFAVEEGDHITMLNVYDAFVEHKKSAKWSHEYYVNYKGLLRAVEINSQLTKLLQRHKVKMVSCDGNVEAIRRCITVGFFANAARRTYTGSFRTVRDDHELRIHPTSVLSTETPPKWVVFNEVVHTTQEFMRDVTVIEPDWLHELAPHYYQFGTEREIMEKYAKRSWN